MKSRDELGSNLSMSDDGNAPLSRVDNSAGPEVVRIESRDLFRNSREVQIAHDGRIYRLRLTQLNKLILTA